VDKPDRTFAVNVRDVSKTFKAENNLILALKKVDFNMQIGELLMIVGPSGCGKTTLLSVIAGTLNFEQGEIDVLGQSLHLMSQKEITCFRKKKIGFIFQQYHLIKTLSCLENVSLPLLLNNVPRREAQERSALLLEQVGLKGREFENPKKLSGGQQQRVAIARALVHEPELIICDEPTSALDAETGTSIMELMQSIVRLRDRTVLIVTHDSRIFKYADRVVKMDDGRILETS
jgi:putative ABC transport system ATP-binding protein